MQKLVWLLLACTAISCSNKVGQEPRLEEEFQLRFGQTAILSDNGLSIKFLSVGEDSRCPEEVRCIWEGNARIAIQVAHSGFALNTTLEPKEVTHSGYVVRLISVNPYPKYGQEIKPSQYVVTLVVRRGD